MRESYAKENSIRQTGFSILLSIIITSHRIREIKSAGIITSSFRLETSSTFEIPRRAACVWLFIAPADVKANAPRLGRPPPYAEGNGVPRPSANGGSTPGVPRPFTGRDEIMSC